MPVSVEIRLINIFTTDVEVIHCYRPIEALNWCQFFIDFRNRKPIFLFPTKTYYVRIIQKEIEKREDGQGVQKAQKGSFPTFQNRSQGQRFEGG